MRIEAKIETKQEQLKTKLQGKSDSGVIISSSKVSKPGLWEHCNQANI